MGIQDAELAARLQAHSIPEPNTGCWLWLGSSSRWGYGQLRVAGKTRQAHRLSYEAFRWAIPAGAFVCHACDTPACVNPAHLFLGTHADNMADMREKGRWRRDPAAHLASVRRGERHGNAKLSTADVLAIRAMLAVGRPGKEVAAQFGVNRSQISRIKTGARRRHEGS